MSEYVNQRYNVVLSRKTMSERANQHCEGVGVKTL